MRGERKTVDFQADEARNVSVGRMRRAALAIFCLVLIGLAAAVWWRVPLAETAATQWLARSYGLDADVMVADLDWRSATISNLTLGTAPALTAQDIQIRYDPAELLRGKLQTIDVGSITLHAKIDETGFDTGELASLVSTSGGEPSNVSFPESIVIRNFELGLETPAGPAIAVGSTSLVNNQLTLKGNIREEAGHTKAEIDLTVDEILAQARMSGRFDLTFDWQSPIWPAISTLNPTAGEVEIHAQLSDLPTETTLSTTPQPIDLAIRVTELAVPELPAPLTASLTTQMGVENGVALAKDLVVEISGGVDKSFSATTKGYAATPIVGTGPSTARLEITAKAETLPLAEWSLRRAGFSGPIEITRTDEQVIIALSEEASFSAKDLKDQAKQVTLAPLSAKFLAIPTLLTLDPANKNWQLAAVAKDIKTTAIAKAGTTTLSGMTAKIVVEGSQAGVTWSVDTTGGALALKERGIKVAKPSFKLTSREDGFDYDLRLSGLDTGFETSLLDLGIKGQMKGSRLSGTAQFDALGKSKTTLGSAKFSGDLNRQSYEADLNLGPVTFVPKGLQPSTLYAGAKRYIRDMSGSIEIVGPVRWQAGKLSSDLKLGLIKISGRAGPLNVQNLSGVIDIDRPWPISTKPDQVLGIQQIVAGLPMTDALLRFELDGDQLSIAEGKLNLAGGTAFLQPGTFSLTKPGQQPFLDIKALSIGEMFKLVGVAGLSGEGSVSGRVPITLFPNGIIIDNANLTADAPGVLRYDKSQAPAAITSAGGSVDLALQALSNFNYKELIVTLNRKLTGDAELTLHLLGSNPNFYEGYPVEFNLSLTGKLDEALRKGLAGYQLPSIIEERLNELQ